MIIVKSAVAALVSCSFLFACSEGETVQKKSFDVEMRAATDARDAENTVFASALQAGNWRALELLGQIGGKACEKLKPYFKVDIVEARAMALTGAAYCYGEEVTFQLKEHLGRVQDETEKNQTLIALAFSSDPAVTDLLVEHFDPTNMASVYALMQKITYDRMQASALTDLPFDAILAETAKTETGFANAYLLARLQGVNAVYSLEALSDALEKAYDQHTKKLLVRLLPQFGDSAAEVLISIANGDVGPAQVEAVRAMGRLGDAATKAYLLGLLTQPEGLARQLALAAFAGRDLEDEDITDRIAQAVMAEAPVAVTATALDTLARRSPEAGIEAAAEMLVSERYYLSSKATSLLSTSDEGKALLSKFAEDKAGTQRGIDARVALDPSSAEGSDARATPSVETITAYQGKQLKLTTTRGDIVISMYDETPYAATSFLQLAESGKMDGMLWHRVIPNFVAQAGQTENMSLQGWGSIREEWFAADHKIGTVGLATIGKDTGSTQFFINTAYNLHLNGRYTVFGEVTEGLDVAMELQEGDYIEKAELVAAK